MGPSARSISVHSTRLISHFSIRAWMLKVVKSLQANEVELLGLDIRSANFPNAAWLPDNIAFAVWDAYNELPAEYEGAFDVVHLRALYSTVIDNKVDALLANCLKMLTPGGFLQWDESDASTLACYTPADDFNATACKQIIALQEFSARTFTKMTPDWLRNLPTTLEGQGCNVIVHGEFDPDKRLARAWTDNVLLVWRSMVALMPEKEMPLPPGMGLPEKLSKAHFAELLREPIEETKQGVMLGMRCHVHVAKKA